MLDVDTIVIGSGAGGLTAAVALARAGERVLVLEQHDRPGGWCHSFTLEGHTFSPGVHYVGDLFPEGRLRAIYEGLGVAGDMEWFKLDPRGFDRVRLADGFAFDIPRGREAFAAGLAAAFPHEAAATGRFLERVAAIDAALSALVRTRGLLDLLTLPVRGQALFRHGLGTLAQLLDASGVRDPRARAVLGIQAGDHGLTPARAPAVVHAAIMAHYFGGGFYPRGGGFAIPRAFVRALRRAGGELRLRAPVAQILVERRGLCSRRRVAIGVRLESGEELRARRVVSNADPGVTFGRLVAPEHVSAGARRKLARARWSISAASLYLALDVDPRSLGLTSGNLWWTEGTDLEALNSTPDLDGVPPGLFVTATSLKDPTKRGAATLEAFAFIPYDLFAPFAGTASGTRTAEYEALKGRLQAWLMRGLVRAVPGVERHVTFAAVGTPLTNEHYVAATHGSLYGTEKTLDQLGPRGWSPRTAIEGLWLCGASTLSHGVGGATLSGLAAARGALGCRSQDLLAAGQAPLRVYGAEDPATWPEGIARDVERARELEAAARG